MADPDKPDMSSIWGPSSAVIARTVGIICIALGFLLGMEAVQGSGESWMQTSLALIVTGLLAQGYAMYCTIQRARHRNSDPSLDNHDEWAKKKDEKDL